MLTTNAGDAVPIRHALKKDPEISFRQQLLLLNLASAIPSPRQVSLFSIPIPITATFIAGIAAVTTGGRPMRQPV
jgi:hypothetical protein